MARRSGPPVAILGPRLHREDLRRKIVAALKRGTSKAQAARLFDVSLSSVKRYARKARQRDSLAPKKGSGRPHKLNENAARLLEEDIKERPAATVEQRRRFLEHLTGKTLSNSTVRRLLKRLGFSRKRGCGGDGARRVLEGGLASDGSRGARPSAAGVRR